MPDGLKPDWREETSRRLADSSLSAAERDEISRELAGYLEDSCSDARSRGLDEPAAAQCALDELHEDARLGANLRRARKENAMHLNDRTKRFWLPGMTTLLGSVACLAILQVAGFQAQFRPLWLRGGAATPNSFYLPLEIYWPLFQPSRYCWEFCRSYSPRRAGRVSSQRIESPHWREGRRLVMADWKSEASRKLQGTGFSAAERDEISRELADYLDDLCADARSRGIDESAAMQSALDELHQDARLGANLRHARKENNMNDRTKGFWLPGLLSLVGSIGFFAIFEIAGLRPYLAGHFGSSVNHFPVTIFLPWLCVLPFLGAASAYFSRRAGSGRTLRVVAGLLPVLGFLTGFVVAIPVVFAVNGMTGINATLPAVAAGMLSMVVIPGVALLLGVLPFLRSADASRRTA